MRTIYLMLTITCTLLALGSCKKLERVPYASVTISDAPDLASVSAVTSGNYVRFKTMATNWHRTLDFPTDDVSGAGNSSSHSSFLYNYRRIPGNSIVTAVWVDSYRLIVSANKLISTVTEGASPDMNHLLGENYFLRAMTYFYMVNIFGKPYSHGRDNLGVPLKTDFDIDIDNLPLRATVGEVYDQIVADLLKAETLMTLNKSNIFASKEVVWAFLSKVYLYMEDHAKTVEYSDKVINSGRYSLVPTAQLSVYGRSAPETNSETIFAIKFIPNADYTNGGFGNIGAMYSQISNHGYGETSPSKTYLDLIMKYPSDERNKFISPVYTNSGITRAYYLEDDFPYNYKSVVVTQSGDDYDYSGGTLEKEANNIGGFNYFITDGTRKQVMILPEISQINGFPLIYMYKLSLQDGQPQLWSPIISRLAEIYLNRAEANAKLGNDDEALDDVNVIRERAGIPPVGMYNTGNLPSGQTVLDVVLDERRLELAWEGHRKFDVYRNKRDLDRKYPGTHLIGTPVISEIKWTDNFIIEFIPESQLLIHAGLEQNPI